MALIFFPNPILFFQINFIKDKPTNKKCELRNHVYYVHHIVVSIPCACLQGGKIKRYLYLKQQNWEAFETAINIIYPLSLARLSG